MNPKRRSKLNIFVTGARGFIGRNLVEYLDNNPNYLLFYPYHQELELLETDKMAAFIKKNKIEIIINLASVGGTRKTGYDKGKTDVVTQNLRIFFNLVRCLDQVKLMIHAGSGAEYSRPHYQTQMSEDYFDTYVPEDAYGFSKYVCSKYIQNSKKIIGLRFFGVFGKYEDYTIKFISNAIAKKLLGLPIVIYQNVYFDYLYIDDLVRIIEWFMNQKSKHKVYNVATGKRVSLLTIARKINQLPGKPTKIIVNTPGLNREYTVDNTRLLKELTEFKFTSLNKALKELYDWYQSRLDKLDENALMVDKYRKHAQLKTKK